MNKFKNQCACISIYGGLLAVIFFIPDRVTLESQIGTVGLVATYNLPFTLYTITFLLIAIGVTIFLYKKLYKTFKNPVVTKKFRYFIIGDCILYYSPLGMIIAGYLNILVIRSIFVHSIVIIFLGLILIYYGIGSDFKTE